MRCNCHFLFSSRTSDYSAYVYAFLSARRLLYARLTCATVVGFSSFSPNMTLFLPETFIPRTFQRPRVFFAACVAPLVLYGACSEKKDDDASLFFKWNHFTGEIF